MKFSVLMAIYGKDNPFWLDIALKSLVNQKLPASEVVLVLDGPISDDLLSVVESYKKSLFLRMIALDENRGLGWALARGVAECSGDWVFRMDADDICCPERFIDQVRYIESHPEIDVLGAWIEEFLDEPRDLKRFRKTPLHHAEISEALKTFSAMNHVTVAIRKKALVEVGSYRGGKDYPEDYDLWIRLLHANFRFANLPKVLVDVRVGNEMLGRRGGWQYLRNEINLFLMAYRFGIIGIFKLTQNLLVRAVTRLAPLRIRSFMYGKARKRINRY